MAVITRSKRARDNAVQTKKYEFMIELIFVIQIFLAGTFVGAMWYA